MVKEDRDMYTMHIINDSNNFIDIETRKKLIHSITNLVAIT